MLPIGQPSNGKIPGEKLLLKVGYFWTGLMLQASSVLSQCKNLEKTDFKDENHVI